jgi:hypothetical protein
MLPPSSGCGIRPRHYTSQQRRPQLEWTRLLMSPDGLFVTRDKISTLTKASHHEEVSESINTVPRILNLGTRRGE